MIIGSGVLAELARQAGDHLWQSTAFFGAAVLLTFVFRKTHARARHWVLTAASAKFLVPFAALARLGDVVGSWIAPAAPPTNVPMAVGQIARPFTLREQWEPAMVVTSSAQAISWLQGAFLAVWLVVFLVIIVRWLRRWYYVRSIVRAAVPLEQGREADALRRLQADGRLKVPGIRLVCSEAKLEPGLFGIFHPVLWVPAGIADRLSEMELEAVLAHELFHARHRDNLAAAIQSLVEAVYWFHPVVWWLGRRMLEERERGCDEQVVRLNGEPQAYAEGILKVCEFYVAAPAACAATITGSDLRRRIEAIVASRFIGELGLWKKWLLAALLAVAVALPVGLGLIKAQSGPKLEFEVASIRAVKESELRTGPMLRIVGNRAEYTEITISRLIAAAYQISPRHVICPESLRHQYFNVICKMPAGSRREDAPLMLRALMAERFGLKMHREPKELKVLGLVVDRGGCKLKESAADSGAPKDGEPSQARERSADGKRFISSEFDGVTRTRQTIDMPAQTYRLEAWRMPMSGLASWLTVSHLASDDFIVDATGLTGTYDVVLDFPMSTFMQRRGDSSGSNATTPGPAESAVVPTDRMAEMRKLLKKVGLDLDHRKVTISQVVIDHVEKTPTEN